MRNKEKVLISMYKEYLKDDSNMQENINSEKLGIKQDEFFQALDKLQNEGLIDGIFITRGGINNSIIYAEARNAIITSGGIDYIENKIGIEKTLDSKEKIKYLSKRVLSKTWDEVKDITTTTIAKTIAELKDK
ncbi:YjcQ family protein [Clostridium perfringens]|uniref:YjcQ family protein n=1 Tax=Clostridium perfringens TaxID=1502 RepID=UPI0024BCE84B|nr:YjcQ family protein [Clostridium perfringens]